MTALQGTAVSEGGQVIPRKKSGLTNSSTRKGSSALFLHLTFRISPGFKKYFTFLFHSHKINNSKEAKAMLPSLRGQETRRNSRDCGKLQAMPPPLSF